MTTPTSSTASAVVLPAPAPAPAADRSEAARQAGSGGVVCRYEELEPERGVAALVSGVQVAIFRLHDGRVLAVGHRDPFSGANVIARGLVGTRRRPDGRETPTVASPMYKQVFDLVTGQCLENPEVTLGSYPVELDGDGLVRVRVRTRPAGPGATS